VGYFLSFGREGDCLNFIDGTVVWHIKWRSVWNRMHMLQLMMKRVFHERSLDRSLNDGLKVNQCPMEEMEVSWDPLLLISWTAPNRSLRFSNTTSDPTSS